MARPSLCQASSIFPKKNSPDGLIFSHPRAIIAVRKDYRFGKGGQSNMMCKDRLTSVRRSYFIYPLFLHRAIIATMSIPN